MYNLIYRNAKGMEININNSMPFVLQNFSVKNSININTTKGMQQDGITYLNNSLDSKDITIELTLTGNSIEELQQLKNKIYDVCNPKLELGELIYRDDFKERKIKCICGSLPIPEQNNGQSYEKCIINLICPNPFWQDVEEIKEEIVLWISAFEFPLELTSEGIELGHREPNLIKNIINNGDVNTGMIISFKALATVVNPSLTNINTQEFIKLNTTMTEGQEIRINTNYSSKRIDSINNNIISNAFNLIDWNSTFLQLECGDNLFRYNADTGLDNLEVNIYHDNSYLGV